MYVRACVCVFSKIFFSITERPLRTFPQFGNTSSGAMPELSWSILSNWRQYRVGFNFGIRESSRRPNPESRVSEWRDLYCALAEQLQIFCPWVRGKCCICDATVCDSFDSTDILDAAVNERVTASVTERNKTLECWDLAVNHLCQPMAVEMFGGIGPLMVKFSSSLAAQLAEMSSDTRKGTCLFQYF